VLLSNVSGVVPFGVHGWDCVAQRIYFETTSLQDGAGSLADYHHVTEKFPNIFVYKNSFSWPSTTTF
jgi:hypothetical protein